MLKGGGNMETVLNEKSIKKEFMKRFSCSETMLTLLDKAEGKERKIYEEAADPLNGGFLAEMDGICGVLWGGVLAAGIRAAEKIDDPVKAADKAMEASLAVLETYRASGDPMDCDKITGMQEWNLMKFMSLGNMDICQGHMVDFVPKFHQRINVVLDSDTAAERETHERNCAMEAYERAVKALSLTEYTDPVIVAGLAGGIAMSGNVCGALAATVYAMAIKYFTDRNKPKHSKFRSNLQGMNIANGWIKPMQKLSSSFQNEIKGKKCSDITGQTFPSSTDLSAFLQEGNCNRVLDKLEALLT